MNTRQRLIRKLRERFDAFVPRRYFAVGLLGDGRGNVRVGNSTNMCYVRVDGALIKAFNQRTAYIDDLPVIVGYDEFNPDTLQVLSVYLANNDTTNVTQVPNHHARHEYLNPDGGDDVVWVRLRQFMPGRVSFNGMTARVYRYAIFWNDAWQYVDGEIDLSPYRPSGGARWGVVFWGDGNLDVSLGATMSDKADLTLADLPPIRQNTVPLVAVRLYAGQTSVSETLIENDVLDVRFGQMLSRNVIAIPVIGRGDGGSTVFVHNAPELLFDGAGDIVMCLRYQ